MIVGGMGKTSGKVRKDLQSISSSQCVLAVVCVFVTAVAWAAFTGRRLLTFWPVVRSTYDRFMRHKSH